ncbi:jg8023 [Pararge aegeria aegeria]|uniref:Jg8023 protein n=1 Tax=Pararge aegeria aegeria TaxID=348720 RepID=A0A8S4RIR3_9NEOP|nr:jg8023 [Pararge aegeria aegeria]
MFMHTFAGFIKITNIQYNLFKYNTNRVQNNFDIIHLVGVCCCLVYIYMLIFLPSIIFEMVIAKLENLRMELADSMITSIDENRRYNLLQLLKCLREQPPKYTLWRAVEVNARLPLAFLSLSVTYLVCLLQLSHILE